MNNEKESMIDRSRSKHEVTTGGVSDERRMPCRDDTVAGKFVDTAIVGKCETEDACHHGLVDPTINMKEAMTAINSMFREPLEIAPVRRESRQCQQKENDTNNGFQEFVDENLDKGDVPSESPNGFDVELKGEDTMMVRRIVGTAISEDPQVENACHHGLVEPTINLREAMDDINNMFGKPIDFVRSRRAKGQDKVPEKKQDLGGFCILPDDDTDDDDEDENDNLEQQQVQKKKELPGKSKDTDLVETIVFTKQAMDDINKMFGMPLDF
ncbi:uncharacterized protein LOC126803761 [Argentina anserina]|uniref:uncharacterized protein LOC126803761 n=1 Tax=Argentina anserina TaxID=57926 RepID=UPI0021767B2A|nr:uncharacterized protein LOC126803761 [Potentilla anserina]